MSSSHLQKVKNNEKNYDSVTSKWLRPLTRGGRLQEVLTLGLLMGKFWCFG